MQTTNKNRTTNFVPSHPRPEQETIESNSSLAGPAPIKHSLYTTCSVWTTFNSVWMPDGIVGRPPQQDLFLTVFASHTLSGRSRLGSLIYACCSDATTVGRLRLHPSRCVGTDTSIRQWNDLLARRCYAYIPCGGNNTSSDDWLKGANSFFVVCSF